MASNKRRRKSGSISLDLPGRRGCFFVRPRFPFIVLVLVIMVSGFYFARRSGNDAQVYSNDFNVFYHAASEVIAGRDPYQSSLGEWTPYLYPPLLAVALTPLALLPLPVAAYVWFLINAVSTFAAAWMSAKLACDDVRPADASEDADEATGFRTHFLELLIACGSLLIVARFALDNFDIGQVNALIAGLVAAHFYCYSRNKRFAAALTLAIAASIKLTPLILIVYHLARRRFKFAGVCAAMFAALTALSFLPLGAGAPNALQVVVNRTIRNEQGFDLAYSGNQSLRGAVARLTTGSFSDPDQNASDSSRRPSDSATLMISLALVAAALIAACQASTELLAAAPFVCCFVLLSPLSWKAHFVVLILPIACLISEAWQSPTRRRAFAIGAASVVAFAFFNLTSPRVIGLAAAEWADANSLVFAGALVVFIASVAIAMTRKFGKQPGVCYSDQSRSAETT
jgi:alpha-1,2-mannosyltransferase